MENRIIAIAASLFSLFLIVVILYINKALDEKRKKTLQQEKSLEKIQKKIDEDEQ